MYQACIFDLDGTLADTLDSIVYFGNSALAECGYPQLIVKNTATWLEKARIF